MVLAVVSVLLVSLAALGVADVSAAVDAAAVEDVLAVADADDVAVVAAAIVGKLYNPDSPCKSFFAGALVMFIRHKGQIAVHTMIMTVN